MKRLMTALIVTFCLSLMAALTPTISLAATSTDCSVSSISQAIGLSAIIFELPCGAAQDIYFNHTGSSVPVSVRVADRCTLSSSLIRVYDASGIPVLSKEVGNGVSKHTIVVPAGGYVRFTCRSNDGGGTGCSVVVVEL